ncbi:hypothetical protein [Absidia glauca]|uniref:Uncharacterized protein n=1 Tax=Absidia glauca TaxID=4829 RepID=A0A168QJ78_ABSGL|nr:hypothetical protein [Absidia glauca]
MTNIFFSTLDLGYDDDDDDNEDDDDDDDDDSPTALYHKIRLLLSRPPSPILHSQRYYTTLVTAWQVTPAPPLRHMA